MMLQSELKFERIRSIVLEKYEKYFSMTFSFVIKIHTGFHPMRKIHNTKSHIVYAGMSKGGGKILTIDS